MINGLIGASLPRDHAYGFIKLGRLIECTDMTTRVMDVAAGDIMNRAGRFGTKGLAISFISSKEDADILAQVQSRFEVDVSELPDQIDISSYMNS